MIFLNFQTLDKSLINIELCILKFMRHKLVVAVKVLVKSLEYVCFNRKFRGGSVWQLVYRWLKGKGEPHGGIIRDQPP